MQKSSFKVYSAIFILFFFLATPSLVFAQCGPGGCSGGGGSGGGRGSAAGGLFGGGGGGGGTDQLLQFAGLASLMQGGAGGGGGGPAAQAGQVLTLIGALTGNMGLLMAGMITSMLGGLAGGSTPQQGNPDEGYVGQGRGYGNGGGRGNPYYPTPTPIPGNTSPTPTPTATACSASVFIVKDTTVTPNVTKSYPVTSSIAQNNCVLAINSDTASHTVNIKKQGESEPSVTQVVTASASHIFRFAAKSVYTLCVDGAATACTTVTVQ